jgi:folate-binding protein YgfZ
VPRALAQDLAEALIAAGIVREHPDTRRVALGLAAFGAELGVADAGNPHELGLTDLVDTVKGCYVGQEVVARLVTYDKVQRALAIVRVPPGCAAGDLIVPTRRLGGRPGRLTTVSQGGSGLALAFAPRSVTQGDVLTVVRDGTELAKAEVIGLVPPRP